MIESLDVILWDKKVGTLVANREGHRSKACFYFDSDYVRDGYDIAPLRAPIKGVAAQRGLPVYPDEERLFGGLPSFIADSLPDHWGNTCLLYTSLSCSGRGFSPHGSCCRNPGYGGTTSCGRKIG